MVKKFTVPCNFVNGQGKFDVWIGDPAPGCHPLKYQEAWLEQNRGGRINTEVMDSFQKLYKLSKENEVSFEELCVYALRMNEENKKKN
jgi:hypothetical protein